MDHRNAYHFSINCHSQTVGMQLEALSKTECHPLKLQLWLVLVSIDQLPRLCYIGLFVFYCQILQLTAVLRGCMYYCQCLSVVALYSAPELKVDCPLSVVNGSVALDPSLISMSFPKEKMPPLNSSQTKTKTASKKKQQPQHLIKEIQYVSATV